MSSLPVSPLAPASLPALRAVRGAHMATAATGIKYKGRDDLLLMLFDKGTTVAGVFTQSLCPGAPVDWCKKNLAAGIGRALVVNAGNANAFTGLAGEMATEEVAQAAAGLINNRADEVFLASTGVIGEVLPTAPIVHAIPDMVDHLSEDGWADAARAIMTTDTFPKAASTSFEADGTTFTITGIAKGSGMIAPDMATMLGFVATDVCISAAVLQQVLTEVNAKSFNCITVDSDTSTSDTVLVFATGAAENDPIIDKSDARLPAFVAALDAVMTDLAQQVVRDGEGATKFIEVTVTGAKSDESAGIIARSVANSPLVKTAIAGADANWGRIVMAVGKAGQPAVRDNMQISIGGVQITEDGMIRADYDEADVQPHMDGPEIEITVDVGTGGAGSATVWTCDLTHGYITINGDYRS